MVLVSRGTTPVRQKSRLVTPPHTYRCQIGKDAGRVTVDSGCQQVPSEAGAGGDISRPGLPAVPRLSLMQSLWRSLVGSKQSSEGLRSQDAASKTGAVVHPSMQIPKRQRHEATHSLEPICDNCVTSRPKRRYFSWLSWDQKLTPRVRSQAGTKMSCRSDVGAADSDKRPSPSDMKRSHVKLAWLASHIVPDYARSHQHGR